MEGQAPEPLAIHNMVAEAEQAAAEGQAELTIMVRNMARRGALIQEAMEAPPMIVDLEVAVSTAVQGICLSALEPEAEEVMVVEEAEHQVIMVMVAATGGLMVALVPLP